MDGKILGRGEDNVHLTGCKGFVDAGTLVFGCLARENRHAHAKGRKLVGEVVRLICHKRAQRVHKNAGTVPCECRARCVDMEDERLSAPCGHHAEGGAADLKA